MFKKKIVAWFVFLAVFFAPSSVARAQTPNSGDVILFGQNYTLPSGKTLGGSLVVVGGNVTIEKDAQVNGSVVVVGGNLAMDGAINGDTVLIGGNLNLAGKVTGNIALIGGQANLTASAVVQGDVSTIGGQLARDPDAKISGKIINNAAPDAGSLSAPNRYFGFHPFSEVFRMIFKSLGMALAALLLTLLLDAQMKRVGDYAFSQPVIAGGVGLLASVVAFLLILTILPIFVLACAWILGVVAIGQEVGRRFVHAINQNWQPILSAAVGTFLLVFVVGLAGLIPCFGWIFKFALALVGIGAAVMTRFGSQSGAAPSVAQGTPAG